MDYQQDLRRQAQVIQQRARLEQEALLATAASGLYERIHDVVSELENEIGPHGRVLVLYRDASGATIDVEFIGYRNPHLIVLYSRMGVEPRQVVLAHMSSLQLILTVVPMQEPDVRRRPIGFVRERIPPDTSNDPRASDPASVR